MTKKPTVDQLLTLLAEHAGRLRAAGVRSFELGGLKAELSPPDPDPTPRAAGEPWPTDPLRDPDTYGSSGYLPGFTREDLSD